MFNLDDIDEDECNFYIQQFQLLAKYCLNKRIAMGHRKDGNINLAKGHEDTMDRIYDSLDDEFKW